MKLSISLILLACVSFFQFSCEKQGDSAAAATSGAGGSLAKFAIVGNYLYIVDPHTLGIFNLTDPANPVFVSQAQIGFDIETIFSYKDKLYMGASNGMYIYSVQDPENPVKESAITHFRACDPVVSNDSMAYVTLRGGTTCGSPNNVLHVYNVKNITQPLLIHEVGMKSPYGLGMREKGLYVCEGDNGLVVFDLEDPSKPERIKTFSDETYYDVIPYNDVLIAYIDKGVRFFDITDPVNPVALSSVKN